jgi:hypothetical protein
MTLGVLRRLRAPAIAAVAAAVLHAIASRQLASVDPIGRLLEHGDAGVVTAAIGVALARLFLFFVAPGWAAYAVVRAVQMPPK